MHKKFNKIRGFVTFALVTLLVSAASPLALAENAPVPAVPEASAPQAAGQAGAPGQPSAGSFIPMMLIMFAIMYFVMIRPQQKKAKEHQNMLSTLKSGDEVVTQAGILGTITGMTEKVVTLEVDKDVRVKMLRSQIVQIVKGQVKDLA